MLSSSSILIEFEQPPPFPLFSVSQFFAESFELTEDILYIFTLTVLSGRRAERVHYLSVLLWVGFPDGRGISRRDEVAMTLIMGLLVFQEGQLDLID